MQENFKYWLLVMHWLLIYILIYIMLFDVAFSGSFNSRRILKIKSPLSGFSKIKWLSLRCENMLCISEMGCTKLIIGRRCKIDDSWVFRSLHFTSLSGKLIKVFGRFNIYE